MRPLPSVMIAFSAIAVASAFPALAQNAPPPPAPAGAASQPLAPTPPPPPGMHAPQASNQPFAPPPPSGGFPGIWNSIDGKIAGMRAALALTAEQEKAWAPFEDAVRISDKDAQAERPGMMAPPPGVAPVPGAQAAQQGSMIDHIADRADKMGKRAADLKRIADTAKPLYAALSDAQKRYFDPLFPALVGGGPRMDGPPQGMREGMRDGMSNGVRPRGDGEHEGRDHRWGDGPQRRADNGGDMRGRDDMTPKRPGGETFDGPPRGGQWRQHGQMEPPPDDEN